MENTEIQQSRWFEMSQGSEHKMYTLWRCVQDSRIFSRKFVKNLGTDHDASYQKALEFATRVGVELIDDSMDELRNIVRGEDVMRFGKHKDKRISELPDGYLMWVAEGGLVPASEEIRRKYGQDSMDSLIGSDSELAKLAKEECVVRGLYKDFEGKLMPIRLANYLINKRERDAKSVHIGTVGEKIEVEVVLESVKYIDTMWGMSTINTLRTTDGSVIKYFGNDLRGSRRYDEPYNIETGETVVLSKKSFDVGITEGRFHTFDPYMKNAEANKTIVMSLESYIKENNISCCHIDFDSENKPMFINYREIEPEYDFELNGTYKLKATVKNHGEYNGTKETQVLRPKLSKIS